MNKLSNLKVLLVDDDDDLLNSMKELFKLFHFTVETASSGEAAWQLLQNNHFDVVLTDVRMSQMSGLKLLQNIRGKSQNRPKVIIASAYSDHPIEELYEAGADAFFSKPFQASTVRDFLWQSMMKPEERWAIRPSAQSTRQLNANFKSLEEARAEEKFSLGRLGFFYRMDDDQPQVDDWIKFSFQFEKDRDLSLLEGIGKVRWVREVAVKGFPAGIGVEIKYLSDNCLKPAAQWTESQQDLGSIPRK